MNGARFAPARRHAPPRRPEDPALDAAGMLALCGELYPMVRSITGDGVRRTLEAIGRHVPLDVFEVPSGTPVFDWTVPPEWNVRAAHVTGPDGRRVVDLAEHSLHLVSYSEPVRTRMSLDALQPHLHSLPEHPEWIPYRTSYYARNWGFCLTQRVRDGLAAGEYEVFIDATLENGHLTYGECVIPGELDDEVIVSTHVCHPSLANDNLSGIAVATALAKRLCDRRPKRTHRFLFVPGTIGAIAWLAMNEERLSRVRGGVVLSGVGDAGGLTYKRSRRGDTAVDRLFASAMGRMGRGEAVESFSPYGYDERQFCSPGIDLAVGCLMRTPFGRYPQYHTSADDLSLLSGTRLQETVDVVDGVLSDLDRVDRWINRQPKCEPQLGRRGLYDAIGGDSDGKAAQMALLWMLSLSDGRFDTLDVAERSGLPIDVLDRAARRLEAASLLARARAT
jgi:aminopeptidase-like protein